MTSRPRSAGVLDAEELGWCHANGIALSYDPAQQGWIVAAAVDDLAGIASPYVHDFAEAPDLAFRAWTADDVTVFRAMLDDPEVWRYMPQPYPDPVTAEIAAQLIAMAALDHHQVRAVLWNGVPVGQVRLDYASARKDRAFAEISYWLGRRHWGKRLGRRIVATATARAFRLDPRLRGLFAWVHPDNAASARVLLAASYAQVATKRHDGWIQFTRTRPPA